MVKSVKALLSGHFNVKDLGEARHFLGMRITEERDSHGVLKSNSLTNENLIREDLESFNIQNENPKSVPLDLSLKLEKGEGKPLRKTIGVKNLCC